MSNEATAMSNEPTEQATELQASSTPKLKRKRRKRTHHICANPDCKKGYLAKKDSLFCSPRCYGIVYRKKHQKKSVDVSVPEHEKGQKKRAPRKTKIASKATKRIDPLLQVEFTPKRPNQKFVSRKAQIKYNNVIAKQKRASKGNLVVDNTAETIIVTVPAHQLSALVKVIKVVSPSSSICQTVKIQTEA